MEGWKDSYCGFAPLSLYLLVNYLDRFLSAFNLPFLLGKLGSATVVGDQRLPWWCLPEITARCAARSRREGDALPRGWGRAIGALVVDLRSRDV